MSFGSKIRVRRQELKLTQESLSKALGYKTNSYVSDVELGKFIPNAEKLAKLGKALKLKKSEIEAIALESRLNKLGLFKENEIVMLKEIPNMSPEEKKALLAAYERVIAARKKSK